MKTVSENRRARFDYEILETVEAGMMLTGQEVKSCRMGHINLTGSYVSFHSGKPILKNASIARYVHTSKLEPYDEHRDRPLLLSRADIRKLTTRTEEKGLTVVPLAVHAGRFIKLLIGIGRGRKSIDKRQHIKEREVERVLKRTGNY
ncbi:MAG: SsrA-binding protein SmpB [Candidatus Peregrinibacteria bacterium]